jgi:hypothetical protein
MRMHLQLGLFLAALTLAGCGARGPVGPAQVDDTQARLGNDCGLNLDALLSENRAALAKRVEDLKENTRDLRASLSGKQPELMLLPRFLPSAGPGPLFQGAYSVNVGFTIPKYLKPGQTDADLALHLARHGDVEAAKKLAPPGDTALQKQIESYKGKRNYPIEWTELVILAQLLGELKLMDGSVDGATELVVLHKQVDKVLDQKNTSGPLGALLLPTGRRALEAAAVQWRKPEHLKSVLADDITAALKKWGDIAAPQPLLVPGASKETVVRILGGSAGPRAVASSKEDAVARALDLLALPLVRDGVDSIVGFLDDKGNLTCLQLVYAGKTSSHYPEPRDLATALGDRGLEATEPPAKDTLSRSLYKAGGLAYEITLVSHSNSLGGVARITSTKGEKLTATLPARPLDFNPLRLDRSFETNRILLDRQKSLEGKNRLSVERVETIKNIQQPIQDPLPGEVVLEREKDNDLVRTLNFRWKAKQNVNLEAATRLAIPLWKLYGPSRVEEMESEVAGSAGVVLTWEQSGVQYALRLPYNDAEALNFAVSAVDQSPEAQTEREKGASSLEAKDRQARLAAGKPIQQLDRWLQVPGLTLGMSRADAMTVLPRADPWRQAKFGDSILLFHTAPPPNNVTSWPRQVIVRFDAKDRVGEIRALYTEGPAKADARNPGLYESLRKTNGEPRKVTASWAGLWSDLPPLGGPAQASRWSDDLTCLQFQRDAFTTEVTVRDCPPDAREGASLPPLATVGTGPDGCTLGTTKADILKKWPEPTSLTDGALVLKQEPASKFDIVLVYFADDKVNRVVGRLRDKPKTAQPGPEGLAALEALFNKFYGSQLGAGLGLLRRRQVEASGQMLAGWGWHDDSVRVWAFGQSTPDGPRAFVEWRHWPVK